MEARYPGGTIRMREAIERTSIVVLGRLVEPGTDSPGPPGAEDVDEARFRIERTLTPPSSGVPRVSGTVSVSYTRRVFPHAQAEAPLQRNASYVLFCSMLAPGRLHALKIVPHSDETVRVVASAFGGGVRHGSDPSSGRLA